MGGRYPSSLRFSLSRKLRRYPIIGTEMRLLLSQ
jgi:hypothetical protein